jgi:glycosyltransferase involved in cell wall biosynthesis
MALTHRDRKSGIKQKMMSAYWRSVIPAVARKADHIITISERSKRDICSILKIPDERITIIPNGVHPDFRPVRDVTRLRRVRDRYQLPDRYVMGFASADPRKNAAATVEAMKHVRFKLQDVDLVLVGCAPQAWKSLNDAADGVRPQFVYCPPRKDLAAIYTMADALVFPSLYEGFGLPVIESMACGTPVVASRTSSIPEVAGNAALLVDPTSPEEIAAALLKVLTDRYWRAELTERGNERAALYSWQRAAEATIGVYQKVWNESLSAARPQTERGGAK